MNQAFLWQNAPKRPPTLQRAVDILSEVVPNVDYRVYGSWWPTVLATGNEPAASDVDIQIGWKSWQELPQDVRRQFTLHEPHARYLKGLWKARESYAGRPEFVRYRKMLGNDGMPHGNAWVLRSCTMLTERVGAPIELIVARNMEHPAKMAEMATLDHLQVVDTPEGMYVTPQALQSIETKTIVWRHIRDGRDIQKGMDLAVKHGERWGWPIRIAPENLGWFGR